MPKPRKTPLRRRGKTNFANSAPSTLVSGGNSGPDYFRPNGETTNLPLEPVASLNPDRVAMSVRLRWNPIRGLTPDRLTAYLDEFHIGFFRNIGQTWEAMEKRDYQLQIVAPKRKKSVARHGYDILTVAQVPAGMDELAKQQVDFLRAFYDNISVTTAIEADEQGGFALLVRQMMDAIGKRYAVHEIVWQPKDDGSLTAQFFFCPLWWFEGTRGKLRYLPSEFNVYGTDMNPGEWLVTVHDGVMEACCIAYLFKNLPMKSLLSLLDRFGTPGVIGKTDATYGSKEWEEMVDAVNDFAENWSAVLNRNGEISLVEAAAAKGGDNLFIQIIDKMDKAITTIWRGADLGTSSKANSVGANLQEDETAILDDDDGRIVEETLTSQVSRHALAWKFGPDAPQLAYLKLRGAQQDTTAKDLQIDAFLLTAGAPLSVKDTLERYNRPMPDDDEELLTKPAAAAPGEDDDEEDPEMSNDRPAPSPAKRFGANAAADVTDALAPDVNMINERFAALLKITDPAQFLLRATQLKQWLTDNAAHFTNNPALADAITNINMTAFASGIANNQA